MINLRFILLFFYYNNGDCPFTDVAENAGISHRVLGLAVAVGDYDNDGYPDPVVLYQNESGSFFTDVSFISGIGAMTLSYFKWAVEFFDYNNDGLPDLFVANGHLQENTSLFSDSIYPEAYLLFCNTRQQDDTYRFADASTEISIFSSITPINPQRSSETMEETAITG